MTISNIPVNQDDNGPKVNTIEDNNNIHTQCMAITNGDTTLPVLISPATEGTLSNIEDNTNVMNDIETALVTVTDTALGTELTAGMIDTRTIMIRNMDSTDTVSIGKTGVTYATGWKLLPDDPAMAFDSSFAWYGICDTSKSVDVNVMELK